MQLRTPSAPYNEAMLAGVQDFYNRKGLISDRGQRKKAFYVLQNVYSGFANSDPK